MMKKKPTRPFNKTSQQLLKNPKVAAEYLEEILADGNMELFTAALKDVADARLGGVSALSKKTELNRQQLYKTLSTNGNPPYGGHFLNLRSFFVSSFKISHPSPLFFWCCVFHFASCNSVSLIAVIYLFHYMSFTVI